MIIPININGLDDHLYMQSNLPSYSCHDTVIGKCSKCGGDVVLSNISYSTKPSTPYCTSCKAKMKKNLPIVAME